jgi:hypothetical protein
MSFQHLNHFYYPSLSPIRKPTTKLAAKGSKAMVWISQEKALPMVPKSSLIKLKSAS